MNTISRSRSVSLQLTHEHHRGLIPRAAARRGRCLPSRYGPSLFLPSRALPDRPRARAELALALVRAQRHHPFHLHALQGKTLAGALVRRVCTRVSRAPRDLLGSIPTAWHHPRPARRRPRDSYRVIIAMPMLDRKASCSNAHAVLRGEPEEEMSMRRVGMETPRSKASVATSANSCAAKRDPRRWRGRRRGARHLGLGRSQHVVAARRGGRRRPGGERPPTRSRRSPMTRDERLVDNRGSGKLRARRVAAPRAGARARGSSSTSRSLWVACGRLNPRPVNAGALSKCVREVN